MRKHLETDSVIVPISSTRGMRRFAREQSKTMEDCGFPNRGSISHYYRVAARKLAREILKGEYREGVTE